MGMPAEANISLTPPPGQKEPYRIQRNGRDIPPDELPMQVACTGIEVRDFEVDLVRVGRDTLKLLCCARPLFDNEGRVRGSVGAFLDITERKRAQEKALQTERLAAIGQMMTGLAHESGNALARSQSCLEMLSWEVEDRPEALDLIGRIQKAQDHLRQLYEEVRGYAAPLVLDREVWDAAWVWRQAWEHLALARQGTDAICGRRSVPPRQENRASTQNRRSMRQSLRAPLLRVLFRLRGLRVRSERPIWEQMRERGFREVEPDTLAAVGRPWRLLQGLTLDGHERGGSWARMGMDSAPRTTFSRRRHGSC